MKRVQAQRKFAQGALIPSSSGATSTTAPDKRMDPPAAEKSLNVFNLNTSAKKFLDGVAFANRGMHEHVARVILERLPEQSLKKDHVAQTKAKKKRIIASHMTLRSKSLSTTVNKKVKNSIKARIQSKVLRKRSPIDNSDDDQPLTYHMNKNKDKCGKNMLVHGSQEKDITYSENVMFSDSEQVTLEPGSLSPANPTQGDPIPGPSTSSYKEELERDPIPGPSTSSYKEELDRDPIQSPSTSSYKEELDRDPIPGPSASTYNEEPDQDMKDSDMLRDPYDIDSDECVIFMAGKAKKKRLNHTPKLGVIHDAPTFYPTSEEFSDPVTYYNKITEKASPYGFCKVVAPDSFKPACVLSGLEQCFVSNQYITRMYKRWGKGTKDMCAIRTYLANHSVYFTRPPLVDSLELNLPKMYNVVQKYGGFKEVIRRNYWTRVAEDMNFINVQNPEKKLDHLYVKYLLPYDIISYKERKKLISQIDKTWKYTQNKLLKRAANPLHDKKVLSRESSDSSSDDEPSGDYAELARWALQDVEECVKGGRVISLTNYQKAARNTMQMIFPTETPSLEEIEKKYWKTVEDATDHLCVYAASIDTSTGGYGFTTDPNDPMSQHGWNLKNVKNNENNILRSLGPVVSVTEPLLHLGMVLSTNCWHRDPHGLPWIEYLHEGAEKIWYGIPDKQSKVFRRAVEQLCPTSVQNKTVWLPSDIVTIPPQLLMTKGVNLTRVTQKPGEYIFFFPKAYSSSICTGFTISESVYFAVPPWLQTISQVFQELHDGYEPMMFAPEQLLIALSRDPRVPLAMLRQVFGPLNMALQEELDFRFKITELAVEVISSAHPAPTGAWNVSDVRECAVCRRPLYLSKVMNVIKNRTVLNVCAKHAFKIFTNSKQDPEQWKLVTLMSDVELRAILKTTQNKLNIC